MFSESSIRFVQCGGSASDACCLKPGLWTTSKSYSLRLSHHLTRCPVATAMVRIHFREWWLAGRVALLAFKEESRINISSTTDTHSWWILFTFRSQSFRNLDQNLVGLLTVSSCMCKNIYLLLRSHVAESRVYFSPYVCTADSGEEITFSTMVRKAVRSSLLSCPGRLPTTCAVLLSVETLCNQTSGQIWRLRYRIRWRNVVFSVLLLLSSPSYRLYCGFRVQFKPYALHEQSSRYS